MWAWTLKKTLALTTSPASSGNDRFVPPPDRKRDKSRLMRRSQMPMQHCAHMLRRHLERRKELSGGNLILLRGGEGDFSLKQIFTRAHAKHTRHFGKSAASIKPQVLFTAFETPVWDPWASLFKILLCVGYNFGRAVVARHNRNLHNVSSVLVAGSLPKHPDG